MTHLSFFDGMKMFLKTEHLWLTSKLFENDI